MSARRILLVGLLVALGLCAAAGIIALGVNSDDLMWQILGAAITTAVACGAMLPLTLLTDRIKLRLCGFVSMGVIILLWLCTQGFLLVEFSRGGVHGRWEWREAVEMSFGFTLFMGIPSVGVSLLNRFAWARYAVPTFLIGAGLSWFICESGAASYIVAPYSYSSSFVESGLMVYMVAVLAAELLINSGCGDRRYFRWPALGAAAIAGLLIITAIWMPRLSSQTLGGVSYELPRKLARLGVELFIPTVVLGHINLLLMARLRSSQSWLRLVTLMAATLGGLLALPLPLVDYSFSPLTDILVRSVVVLSIITGCGSVGLVVLSMLNRKPDVQHVPGALTATDVTLFCPRCQTRQTLGLGDAACKNCELRISIKVIEPRCPGCGYLLYQLTSNRCPECGASIRDGDSVIAPQTSAPIVP